LETLLSEEFLHGIVVHHTFSCYPGFILGVLEEVRYQ
jgi:hypothetical protein